MTDQPATLAAALLAFRARAPRIVKDDKGQAGNRETRYANLARITDAVEPLLIELRLVWTCLPTMSDGQFVLRYKLEHEPSGEYLTGDYPLPSSSPQTMGGAITYARRYALCAVLNIAPVEDDDDADAATRAAERRQEMRTQRVAEERASVLPASRPAERLRGRLPDDQWSKPGGEI